MLSLYQATIVATLSASFAYAFNPVFTSPRQCSSLRITWTSFDLPASSIAFSDITMTLVPLDNDPARLAPQPYTVAVPFVYDGGEKDNQFEIPSLPFPGGTQFFASAYLPGTAGPVRRTVSSVFTVEHSEDSSCLSSQKPDSRARVKAFGKRQVNVIGTGAIDATQTAAPGTSSASATGGATSVINVIGIGSIPATGTATDSASVTVSSSSAAASSTGAPPPIRVIGTTTIPATGNPTDVPGNVAPSPSSTGPVPAISVIGTGLIPADNVNPTDSSSTDESATPTATVDESSSMDMTETSTSCTETPTETPNDMESDTSSEMGNDMTTMMMEAPMDMGEDTSSSDSESQPCESTEGSSETSMEDIMPTEDASSSNETSSSEAMPSATETTSFDTAVRHYDNFDDMVNAANSMFHAWNPYRPASTASA